MSKGTYEEFRDALRAFESGWDRDRYDNGIIIDAQLDQWAGGPVTEFYPGYSSWGDLTDAEWDAMSYRSTNSLGFVGYQFGEALLIDLGYYDDDVYYLGGDTINRWDGDWTGKAGVTSLDDFMTAEAQEVAIQEAFGFNLQIIEQQLGYQGYSLDDFIGETFTYQDVDGSTVSVEITVTGLMAASHLRGAFGTVNLLLGGGASTDENGTSILRYIEEYGGYDSPSVDEAIAFFEDRKTGDEGLGTPGGDGPGDGTGDGSGDGSGDGGDTGGTGPSGNGDANVTKETADVVITWSYGSDTVISDFDPATDTIFIDWIGADALEVVEYTADEGTAFGVTFFVPSNNQSTTLENVSLGDLSAANFTILDDTAAAEVLGLIGDGSGMGDGDGHGDGGDGDGHGDGGDGGDGHGDGGDDGHGNGHMHQHVYINLDTPAQVIDGFMPGMGDMIEIEADVTADAFNIFEESGDALGQTVRIELTQNGQTKQIVFTGFGLDDLTLANITAANQGVQNEIAAALGAVNTTPEDGEGYTLSYDNDGSNPPETTGATEADGVKYKADSNADDIVGFDITRDELDFGGTSVHGMIITKSEAGEIVIDSPWSEAAQIVQGVTYQDVTIDSFGVVGNEHLRQDLGGVVSWEQGVGPRADDTVYIRSHEYGASEVIDGFDPTSMKISFLYFGTRERLSVEDSAEGLVISSLPSGQSFTFTGVTKAELIPGMVEFHFDQVMEDNLEDPFGFDQNDVTLVDRTMLLTPEAPAGASTDGFQTRTGDLTGSIYEGDGGDGGDGGDTGGDGGDGGDTGGTPGEGDTVVFSDGTAEAYTLGWSYGSTTTIAGFNPAEDTFDFGSFSGDQIAVTEQEDSLVFEVLGNGGDFVVLDGVQAEDLTAQSLSAPSWSGILDEASPLVQALTDLGMDLG
ncbi:hypothetical protein [Dinoroseobacter sp. S124A]|uniref:hypothetical protein n=1 Tax=Dinoroseobacter sp. S124A TaxID=3415128 RepID=UPI003C7CC712